MLTGGSIRARHEGWLGERHDNLPGDGASIGRQHHLGHEEDQELVPAVATNGLQTALDAASPM
jgi:hypothetical protein